MNSVPDNTLENIVIDPNLADSYVDLSDINIGKERFNTTILLDKTSLLLPNIQTSNMDTGFACVTDIDGIRFLNSVISEPSDSSQSENSYIDR
jgi:hypothetical protein